MLKGIIFDMDGVIVDSEEFICEAAIKMFAERGVNVSPSDFIPFVGTGEDRYIGGVAEKYGLEFDAGMKTRTYEIYAEIVKGRLSPLRGVVDFIAKSKAKGLKLAVASSADRIKVDVNLKESGLPPDTFDVIVSGSDVVKKKPDPEIFLTAASRLGLRPEECLVVEDAVSGVRAAKAGSFRCLALTTSFTAEELADADWTAPDLAEAPKEAVS